MLHLDLKELVLSVGKYRYVLFAVDEFTRYIFVDFIKAKSEAAESAKRIIAAFNATVGVQLHAHRVCGACGRVCVGSQSRWGLACQRAGDLASQSPLHGGDEPRPTK